MWPLIALSIAQMVSQQQQDASNRKVDAAKARWSPWTGMQPGQLQMHSAVAPLAQGYGAALMQGQSNALTQAQMDAAKKQADYWDQQQYYNALNQPNQ